MNKTEALRENVLQIPEEVEQLVESINRCHGAFNSLSERLYPVINTSLLAPSGEGDEMKESSLSPLAEEIREQRHSIEGLTYEIQDTISYLTI